MRNKNESGSLIIAIIVIVAVFALTVFVVWRFATSGSDTKQNTAQTSQNEEAPDPTAEWKEFVAEGEAFRFKYPDTWLSNSCADSEEVVGPGKSVSVGPDEESLPICNTDKQPLTYFDVRYDPDFTLEQLQSLNDPACRTNFKVEFTELDKKKAAKTTYTEKPGETCLNDSFSDVQEYSIVSDGFVYTALLRLTEENKNTLNEVYELIIGTWQVQ